MDKTIHVSEKTHKRLEEKGRKGDTFDVIINRLIDYFELRNPE